MPKNPKNRPATGLKAYYFLIVCMLFPFMLKAETGSISGKVLDAESGEQLIGAAVFIEGTTLGSATDLDGNYNIVNLKAGVYELTISYISYKTEKIAEVRIQSGEETRLDISLKSAEILLNSAEVVARANRESFAVLLSDQKIAFAIQEQVGAQQLSIQGVSDAAGASTKISGVTKSEGSGEIFVRGLGDRYLSTTMNGLPIPSDNVDKKNIDLSLFESSIIQNLGISKTYNTESFADQAAGNVNIVSKEYSDKSGFGIQGGINSQLQTAEAWSNHKSSPNTESSFLSFPRKNFLLTESLSKSSWDPRNSVFPADWGLNALGGYQFKLHDQTLKMFYNLSYKQDYSYSNGVYRKYVENILQNEFTDTESWSFQQNLTGLLNLSYDLSESASLSLNALFINKLSDNVYEQGRNQLGYIRDSGEPSDDHIFERDQNTKTTNLQVYQLLGRKTIKANNTINWGIGFNMVDAMEPNRIRNRIGYDQDQLFLNMHGIGNYDNRRSSQQIRDRELNAYLKDQFRLNLGKHSFSTSAGFNFRHKSRDFESRFVGADIKELSTEGVDIDNLSLLFTQEAFSSALIRELPQDEYSAVLNVLGVFVHSGFDFGKLSGNFGFRLEADQLKLTWDINNDQYYDLETRDSLYAGIYPSLNFKYELSEKHFLRLSGSKTITIPEFKELAPFPYVSPTGSITKGNPELNLSDNYNLDFKWEYFKSNRELLSLTGFYKYIRNPINLSMERGAARSFVTANTGSFANVFGLEAEARLELYNSEHRRLNLMANATRMWFKQELLPAFYYNDKTSSGLQGAPEFITNLTLSYEDKSKAWMAALTANYTSDRIFALGHPLSATHPDIYFNEDIIEEARMLLDLVLGIKLSENLKLKFTARNLLNPAIVQTQKIIDYDGDESQVVVESFKKGTKMQLSLVYQL